MLQVPQCMKIVLFSNSMGVDLVLRGEVESGTYTSRYLAKGLLVADQVAPHEQTYAPSASYDKVSCPSWPSKLIAWRSRP